MLLLEAEQRERMMSDDFAVEDATDTEDYEETTPGVSTSAESPRHAIREKIVEQKLASMAVGAAYEQDKVRDATRKFKRRLLHISLHKHIYTHKSLTFANRLSSKTWRSC